MNKKALPLLLVLILFVSSTVAQETSNWKGFTRYDFSFEEREARLIVPHRALPGNPWLWHARFPDYHSEIDSMLVAKGFHIAYINTGNLYGSPAAMKIWDQFYSHVKDHYSLLEKVALSGHSRGGLFIYNWAKKNPEKVACIYAEAPVCDFKSWPGGFGAAEGSRKDWSRLKAVYGFASDEEAKVYNNNPLDQLESLASARVPILHTVGLDDRIVPPEENTFLLVNSYIRLGGVATVVPCTQGVHKLEGHHFPIDDPQLVVDFITYHSLRQSPLDASSYHKMRGDLNNCRIRFEREGKGRVAFLGGSITYNPGWRDSICNYLTDRFPDTEFEFIAAGIPSMGTTPGAFRLERDVLSHGRIDLLFEEAAVNDAGNGRSSSDQIRAMEGIVRHMRNSNPFTDMVIMHFVDPDKMNSYRAGKEPEVIRNHNQVAEHYRIPSINLAREVTERINHGEFSWEHDFKNLHPSPFGQGIYARSIIHFLENAFDDGGGSGSKLLAHCKPDPLDPFSYENGHLLDISSASYSEGWQVDPRWKPKDGLGTRSNYVDVPMLIAEEPGSTLQLKFKGKAVGIAVAAGGDAGIIDFRINQGEWQQLNLFTPWSNQLHLPWYYTLSDELAAKDHLLEVRIADSKDERSTAKVCRIRYFYVNGPGSD